MNTKLILLLLTIIAACVIAVRSFSPDTQTEAQPPSSILPVVAKASSHQVAAHPSEPAAETAEAAETEIVMGIEVRRDRNCTVERHYVDLGNGTVTEAYSCVPTQIVADDYESYSDEELRVLSYSDANSASVLGKRLLEVDLAASRALLLRAVALQPANLDPVMWLAAQAYSLRGDTPAANEARANAYVLVQTAKAMGSPASVEWIFNDLEEAGFGATDFARLDEQVRKDLRRIREIQLEVFGESVVDEVLL